jgi:hypothetical protein
MMILGSITVFVCVLLWPILCLFSGLSGYWARLAVWPQAVAYDD